jgi:hypothetical protein
MTDPNPIPPHSLLPRTVRRIIAEALAVAVLGALVFGILWELQLPHVGWIVAGIIWIGGTPLLELIRLRQPRR